MYLDRLELVADHLDTVVVKLPPEEFDMGVWACRDTCGTAACALGHAANIPQLRALGLEINFGPIGQSGMDIGIVTFQGYNSFPAAARLFDLTGTDQASYLFGTDSYDCDEDTPITPQMVSAKIRKFIADNEHFRSPPSLLCPSGDSTSAPPTTA